MATTRILCHSPSLGSVTRADAIVLRLGLGQEDLAIADAKKYQANYGQKNPQQTAQIAFAVGAHYADQEKWDDCRKV